MDERSQVWFSGFHKKRFIHSLKYDWVKAWLATSSQSQQCSLDEYMYYCITVFIVGLLKKGLQRMEKIQKMKMMSQRQCKTHYISSNVSELKYALIYYSDEMIFSCTFIIFFGIFQPGV